MNERSFGVTSISVPTPAISTPGFTKLPVPAFAGAQVRHEAAALLQVHQRAAEVEALARPITERPPVKFGLSKIVSKPFAQPSSVSPSPEA